VEWTGTVAERWAAALRNNRRIARAVTALPDKQREALEREVLDAFRVEEARGDDATVAVVVAVGVR
jgi:DNA-directed RNA polymerase specialized sigma24 family protein